MANNPNYYLYPNYPEYAYYPPLEVPSSHLTKPKSPSPPPGLGWKSSPCKLTSEQSYLLEYNYLADALKTAAFSYNGTLFGDFVIKTISPDFILDTQQRMDILVTNNNCQSLVQYIAQYIDPYYTIAVAGNDIIHNPDIYNNTSSEPSIPEYEFKINKIQLTFSTKTYNPTGTIKQLLVLCIYSIWQKQNEIYEHNESALITPELLELLNLTYQHDYLAMHSNGEYYILPYLAGMIYSDNKYIVQDIIKNVKNNIHVFMSTTDSLTIIDTIKKDTASIMQSQKGNNKNKMRFYDRLISPRTKIDYFICIPSNSGKCYKCSVTINNQSGEICYITKCCRHWFHRDCLLELYLPNSSQCENETRNGEASGAMFKCPGCLANRPDKLGKNSEILLGL